MIGINEQSHHQQQAVHSKQAPTTDGQDEAQKQHKRTAMHVNMGTMPALGAWTTMAAIRGSALGEQQGA